MSKLNLLLYSDFYCMPTSDVFKSLKGFSRPLTCLFCNYADEQKSNYYKRTIKQLKKIFDNIIELQPNYKFNNAIDAIFINGGNNFELIYKLKKYNQFNKLKKIIENGTLYIGNSAGSVICGKNILWTKAYEPPQINDCLAEENCIGFEIVDRNILAHASKFSYRENKGLLYNKNSYYNYVTIKLKQPNQLKIPNNGVAIINGDAIKVKTYSWKKIIDQKTNIKE